MDISFEGAVFDLDGTLLSSTHVWQRIDEIFLSSRGLSMPADYLEKVGALSLREAARYTIDLFGLSDPPEALMDEWQRLAMEYYAKLIELKPHALSYLTALHRRGVKLAVATGLPEALCLPALKRLGIYRLFTAVCSVDHVGKGKNFPDVFLLAAKRLGLSPSRCLAFDDVLDAVKSAKEAGLTVFAVYDGHSASYRPQLEAAADYYIMDMREAPLPAAERA